MRQFLRWWLSLGKAERIVALSISLSAPIFIMNSTVWAVAACYMVHEKSRVEIERLRFQAHATHPTHPHAPGETVALPDVAPAPHSPSALR